MRPARSSRAEPIQRAQRGFDGRCIPPRNSSEGHLPTVVAHSTNGSCHTTIDPIQELRSAEPFDPSLVARVRVDVSTATKKHVGWPYEPGSVTTAQMNLPYIVAVTLTDGAAFVDQLTETRISDPRLSALAGRVQVEAAPDVDAKGHSHRHYCRLRIELTDGRLLEHFPSDRNLFPIHRSART